MRQHIDGYDCYVVDFATMPELPITWSTPEEKPFALALAHAIQTEVITEPGKYGIHLATDDEPLRYSIFTINE